MRTGQNRASRATGRAETSAACSGCWMAQVFGRGLFRRYGIDSPALDWDKELMFKHEAAYAQAHHDLPAKVFFSVGAYENLAGWKRFLEQLPPDERAKPAAEWDDDDPLMDCVAPTERMVAALRGRGYPSLEIECEVPPANTTRPPRP